MFSIVGPPHTHTTSHAQYYAYVLMLFSFPANSSSLILLSSGFMAGKNKTSLILFESVRNIVSLSIPMPHPPVGGKPYSRAVQKPSSINIASSSPDALSLDCCSNRDLCTAGSFNSVYALQISFLQQKSSNRSVNPFSERCHLAVINECIYKLARRFGAKYGEGAVVIIQHVRAAFCLY